MNRVFWFVGFGALLIAALVLIPVSTDWMPELIATHFGPSGDANGFMPRSSYLALQLAMTVGLPVALVVLISLAASGAAPLLSIPNRAHWFALERRQASAAFMRGHALRLGCALVLFFGGLHGLLLLANQQHPARLPLPALLVLTAVFLLAVIAWVITLMRRFRSPG